ncbi:hypothetical protein SDC9_154787 [bioreactor metagenome]|uniref:Uncharacterized protein n=1 Tax=bioreactor metagenome TaxID=1076179 RepID=A0A645EZZ5_9ZZZZ
MRRHQVAGDHQPPGGGIDKQRATLPEVGAPVALADLVADQQVHRLGIGNAQQCLGQAHQGDALLAGQGKLVHQVVDAARRLALRPHGRNQFAGPPGGGCFIERPGAVFGSQRGNTA